MSFSLPLRPLDFSLSLLLTWGFLTVLVVALGVRFSYLRHAWHAYSFTPVLARVMVRFIRTRETTLEQIVRADGAPEQYAVQRHAAWLALRERLAARGVKSTCQYKEWMERGWTRVRDLGPVLGPLHPIVADNIACLKAVAGLDEVSFHASGTEAVMAATRLVRFNTRRNG